MKPKDIYIHKFACADTMSYEPLNREEVSACCRACCGGVIGLTCAHTLPILFVCMGFLLPNIDDSARTGLQWAGYSLLILLWSTICCTLMCLCASVRAGELPT